MGKMAWIHHLASNNKEEELLKLLLDSGWRAGAAKIGVKEFIKAANDNGKEEKKKKKNE